MKVISAGLTAYTSKIGFKGYKTPYTPMQQNTETPSFAKVPLGAYKANINFGKTEWPPKDLEDNDFWDGETWREGLGSDDGYYCKYTKSGDVKNEDGSVQRTYKIEWAEDPEGKNIIRKRDYTEI